MPQTSNAVKSPPTGLLKECKLKASVRTLGPNAIN